MALRRYALGNRRNQPAAVGALMLGAAGDKNSSVADHAGDEPAERATHVTLRIDVGVVQHRVALAADDAMAVRLAFDEHGAETRKVTCADLRVCFDAKIAKHRNHSTDVERIHHRTVRDHEITRPGPAVAEY